MASSLAESSVEATSIEQEDLAIIDKSGVEFENGVCRASTVALKLIVAPIADMHAVQVHDIVATIDVDSLTSGPVLTATLYLSLQAR